MKISIAQNQGNGPIVSFTKLHVHRSTRLSQLHQIECDMDPTQEGSKVVAAYSLAEAFIMINMAVEFAHNESHKDKQLESLVRDFDNLKSKPIGQYPKDPFCGKPVIQPISIQPPNSADSMHTTQSHQRNLQGSPRNDGQSRHFRKKAKSSTGFSKLPEKIDNDPVIEKLRQRKIRELEKLANSGSKKKGKKDGQATPHRKLSSHKFTFDYDGTKLLCASQFKKRNMLQLIPMNTNGGPKVTSKTPNQTFESKNQIETSKAVNRPVRISIYEHRNQYIHSISNQLNIPIDSLLSEDKPKEVKKGCKKPMESVTSKELDLEMAEKRPLPQRAILTRDQRRNRNLIKVSSLWKEQMEDILEKVKSSSVDDRTGSTTHNPSYSNTPKVRQSQQQIDANTNFDILILTSSEWGARNEKDKPIHNPSSFKQHRDMAATSPAIQQSKHRTLRRAKMQEIDLMW